jgi:RND family efflux transporter MFP subunit
MVIPKKILTVSLVVILLAAAAYFVVLPKLAEHKQNQGIGTAPGASAGAPGSVSGAASGATGGAGSEAAAGQPGSPDQKTEAPPLPVKVVEARQGDLVISLKSPGEAYTQKIVVLRAEVSGEVKNLYAAEGKHVRENEVLLELDDQKYRLNLERLEASRLKSLSELFLERQFSSQEPEPPVSAPVLAKVDTAKKAFDQASAAFEKGLISRAQFDKTQNDYEVALIEAGRKKDEIMASSKGLTQTEIDIKIAQMDLDKTRVRAPFAGIITDIKISPRERIEAGRELFTLVDISQIKVRAKVLESEIGKMKEGREVDLRFSAYAGKVFKGVVEAVSPIVNPDDKTCSVYVAVNNPTEEIKPGMHAEVEIAAEIYQNRLIVPQEAILVRSGRKLVFVVEGDLAKWRYVEIGLENEKYAEILDGVKKGEPVIVEGHFTLAHDARVTITK